MIQQLPANVIDRLLKKHVRGAELNDPYQARQVHKYLCWMLDEHEVPAGKWWLTEYGRTLLRDMHHGLSTCPEQGKELIPRVLKIVMLAPVVGDKRNLGDVQRDIEIARTVIDALENQRRKGERKNITKAAKQVADSGEYELSCGSIRNKYYDYVRYFKGDWQAMLPTDLIEQLEKEKQNKR